MNRLWIIIIFVFTLFISLSVASLQGHAIAPSDTLILTDSHEEYTLAPYLEFLADPEQTLSFSQISSSEYSNAFQPSSEFDFSIGSSAYWLRIDLTNQAKDSTTWLLLYDNYRLNFISVYLPDSDTDGYQQVHTGNALPPEPACPSV